jgi:hypothetical protein
LLLVATAVMFCIGCIKGYTNKDLVTLLIEWFEKMKCEKWNVKLYKI